MRRSSSGSLVVGRHFEIHHQLVRQRLELALKAGRQHRGGQMDVDARTKERLSAERCAFAARFESVDACVVARQNCRDLAHDAGPVLADNFDRQALLYEQIKAFQSQKKASDEKSAVQQKIDQNRKGAFYQPSGVGSSPYAAAGDFSPSGQKASYEKLQELKARLRL